MNIIMVLSFLLKPFIFTVCFIFRVLIWNIFSTNSAHLEDLFLSWKMFSNTFHSDIDIIAGPRQANMRKLLTSQDPLEAEIARDTSNFRNRQSC